MGIEYEEYIVKIKNKRTKRVIELKTIFPHYKGNKKWKPETFDDYEIIDFKIVYG